ncbi:MAG: AMP-binding protein [Actinobacteria bacterium]|nr:AMP-binding protein [Actinomycetota bacterium]
MVDWKTLRRDVSLGVPALRALFRSGLTPPLSPVSAIKISRDLAVYGPSPAIGFAPGAARHPEETAVVDELDRRLNFRQAEDLTRDCFAWLREQGVDADSAVGVLGRNSIGMAVAIAAVARTGADLVYLNPGFTASQVSDIIKDRGIGLVLVDDELRDRVPAAVRTEPLTDPWAWAGSGSAPTGHIGTGRHIILTSGTTGRPKGADRSATPLEMTVSLLDSLPYRQRATHIMAAPMFHGWGWLNHRLAALLSTTEIMVPRPSAEQVLKAAAENRAEIIVTTPVVVRRLVEADPSQYDLSNLRGVLVSGSAIPPQIITEFSARYGSVLYNLYGTTEVALATFARPEDLQAAPDTAGRPLPGVEVAVLDPEGVPVPVGESGQVWVGSAATFGGYLDGGDKDRREGLVATGDLGYFNESGLLFIQGRADDLIISGGENVHPAEVEVIIRDHPDVQDVAAVGRADEEFGQAVVAHVVPDPAVADLDAFRADVLEYAAERLAPYQRPREIIVETALPTNETGKVLRRALAG